MQFKHMPGVTSIWMKKWVQFAILVAAIRIHISEMYFNCEQMIRFARCAPGPLPACSVTGDFLLVWWYLHTYFLLCDQLCAIKIQPTKIHWLKKWSQLSIILSFSSHSTCFHRVRIVLAPFFGACKFGIH